MIDYGKVLNKTVTDMKPSGIRKFFDIAASMDDVIIIFGSLSFIVELGDYHGKISKDYKA